MRKTLALLRRNWKAIIQFELVYKVFSLAVFTPLALALVRLSVRAAGLRYLDAENFSRYLRHPISLMVLLTLALTLALFTLLDMAAVIWGLEEARCGRRVSMPALWSSGLRSASAALRRGPVLLSAYVILLIPLLNAGAGAGFLSTLSVPAFVVRYIRARPLLQATALAAGICLAALAVRLLPSLHICCIDRVSFPEAMRRSFRITRHRTLRNCLLLLLWNGGTILLLVLLAAGGTALASLLWRQLLPHKLLLSAAMSFVVPFVGVLYLLLSSCTVPVFFSLVSVLYYRDEGLPLHPLEPKEQFRARRLQRGINAGFSVLLLLSAVLCGVYAYALARGDVSLEIEHVKDITVTAHRGSSGEYPENTMPAFRAAAEAGADYLELDVQQTRDGVLVVLHDASLRRVAGVSRNIWEMTWDEARLLDVGSSFSPVFAGTPIPTLDEVLAFAEEEHLRLNIELKPTGHETELEQQVSELIRAHNMERRCVVTSQKYDTLQRLKKFDPELTTVYVMSVAYGRITDLQYADEFSVRYNFVTQELVSSVHQAGKRIRVWTVNSQSVMDRMIRLDVDDLITDRPALAVERVARSRTSNLVDELTRRLLGTP